MDSTSSTPSPGTVVTRSAMSLNPNNGSRQGGAVLIVSLMLLLVLTIIGVTSMSSSNMEEKMAANTMNYNITFHASESAVNAALEDTESLAQSITSSTPITVNINLGDSSVTSAAEISYLGAGIAVGYSLGENASAFSSYRFDATGTGSKTSTNATTVTSQGVRRIGPKV